MKLRTFDIKVLQPGTRITGPAIYFHHKGKIVFSKDAVKLLGLKIGDFVSFFQDEENEQDWYLAKTAEGFRVVCGHAKKQSLAINSASLVKLIFNSVSCIELSGTVALSQTPVNEDNLILYPVITSALKNKS